MLRLSAALIRGRNTRQSAGKYFETISIPDAVHDVVLQTGRFLPSGETKRFSAIVNRLSDELIRRALDLCPDVVPGFFFAREF